MDNIQANSTNSIIRRAVDQLGEIQVEASTPKHKEVGIIQMLGTGTAIIYSHDGAVANKKYKPK